MAKSCRFEQRMHINAVNEDQLGVSDGLRHRVTVDVAAPLISAPHGKTGGRKGPRPFR
jgi:hypothetical protein